MRLVVWMIGLMACAPESELLLPAGEEAPPALITLGWSGNNTHGGAIQLDAAVAPAIPNGAQVWFVTTEGGLGAGQCPPALMGECLDIVGPPHILGSARVVAGHATKRVRIPLSAGLEGYFQAIVFAGGPLLSSPLAVPLQGGPLQDGDVCQNTPYACDAGLACCYPCGIQGCQNTCMPACPPGTPWCIGECPLFP
jgi:hypothetical protein